MLKLIGVTALGALLPKLSDKIGDAFDSGWDYLFGDGIVKEEPKELSTRKKYDTTKFTQEMALVIRHHHAIHEGTGLELTKDLNEILGLDKSCTSYAKIWDEDFNPYSLTEGDK